MDEDQKDLPSSPMLSSHRSLPGDAGGVPEETRSLEVDEQAIGRWLAAPGEVSSPVLGDAGKALAGHIRPFIKKAVPLLEAVASRFRMTQTPDVALQRVDTLCSLLQALPEQMSAGLESSGVQVDWLFSRLLSAPGRPGMIEQVIDTLSVLYAADEFLAEREVVITALSQVHRELVTARQTWQDLAEATILEEFPELTSPQMASESQGEFDDPVAAPSSKLPPPRAALPLPARGVLVGHAAGRVATRSTLFRSVPLRRGWLALGMVLLMLLIAGTGVVLLQGRSTPATNIAGVAFSSTPTTGLSATPTPPAQTQPTPTPSSQPTSTPPLPVVSPTPQVPSPTPPVPSPTRSPAPSGLICPSGSAFCVSTLQLQLTCTGASSGTLQLLNNTAQQVSWQASVISGPGKGLLTISPAGGELEPAQQVSLLVDTGKQQWTHQGTIQIIGPVGTTPIIVGVPGCG